MTDFKTLALNLHNKLRTSHRCQPLVLNETVCFNATMNKMKLHRLFHKYDYSYNLAEPNSSKLG